MNNKYITGFVIVNPLGEELDLESPHHSYDLEEFEPYSHENGYIYQSTPNRLYGNKPKEFPENTWSFKVESDSRESLDKLNKFILKDYYNDQRASEFTIKLTFRDQNIDIIREFHAYVDTATYNRLGETTEKYVSVIEITRSNLFAEIITYDIDLVVKNPIKHINPYTYKDNKKYYNRWLTYNVDHNILNSGKFKLDLDLLTNAPLEITMRGQLVLPSYKINGKRGGVNYVGSALNDTLVISSFPKEERVELNGENYYNHILNTSNYGYGLNTFPYLVDGINTFDFSGCQSVSLRYKKYFKLP